MSERSINISPKELLVLVEWVSTTFDKPPVQIKLIATATGIGTHIRAEIQHDVGVWGYVRRIVQRDRAGRIAGHRG